MVQRRCKSPPSFWVWGSFVFVFNLNLLICDWIYCEFRELCIAANSCCKLASLTFYAFYKTFFLRLLIADFGQQQTKIWKIILKFWMISNFECRFIYTWGIIRYIFRRSNSSSLNWFLKSFMFLHIQLNLQEKSLSPQRLLQIIVFNNKICSAFYLQFSYRVFSLIHLQIYMNAYKEVENMFTGTWAWETAPQLTCPHKHLDYCTSHLPAIGWFSTI